MVRVAEARVIMIGRHVVACLSLIVMVAILWAGFHHASRDWRARRAARRIAAQRRKARRTERDMQAG
jgi:hypothetical protein